MRDSVAYLSQVFAVTIPARLRDPLSHSTQGILLYRSCVFFLQQKTLSDVVIYVNQRSIATTWPIISNECDVRIVLLASLEDCINIVLLPPFLPNARVNGVRKGGDL